MHVYFKFFESNTAHLIPGGNAATAFSITGPLPERPAVLEARLRHDATAELVGDNDILLRCASW